MVQLSLDLRHFRTATLRSAPIILSLAMTLAFILSHWNPPKRKFRPFQVLHATCVVHGNCLVSARSRSHHSGYKRLEG
ncbi:hypothetical protein CPC08DRAFT_364701 [Agrocybe pediades]|nr:hypothetical protein CPC08DRAFT_364701 [Agrocybe pediades]